MPESRYEAYCQKTDFIQKHIFPGGHCPSVTAITNASSQATSGILSIDNIENIGPHYAKCLRTWRQSFLQNIDSLGLYDDYFKRKWEFYFAYCEIGFASRTLGVMHIRFTRCNNTSLIGDIPLV